MWLVDDLPWYTVAVGQTGGIALGAKFFPGAASVPAQLIGAAIGTAVGLEGAKAVARVAGLDGYRGGVGASEFGGYALELGLGVALLAGVLYWTSRPEKAKANRRRARALRRRRLKR